MKIFIKKTMFFLFAVVLILVVVGYILECQFNKDGSDKINWQKNIKNNQFDYAFIGSSRTLNMIDINLIDSTCSSKGINLGIGGADYRTLFMSLLSFIEIQNNQLLKIYIQVDPFMIYKDSVYNKPDYDHYFYSNSSNEIIYDCIEKKDNLWIYRVFPIIKYIEYNKVYNLTHFVISFLKTSKNDETKGSLLIIENPSFNPIEQEIIEKKYTSPDDLKYLNKIIKYCIIKDIDIILYTAPIYNYENYFTKIYPDFEFTVKTISDSLNLSYFDFADIYQNNKDYFYDMNHLNYIGTNKLTLEIINKTSFTTKHN